MKNVIVCISDMVVESDPNVVLRSYSLGSCLCISMYEPSKKIGGMINCMLPHYSINPEEAVRSPCMFVDSGVPKLLESMVDAGCSTDALIVKVTGVANVLSDEGWFNIAERNYTVFKELMEQRGMAIDAEHIGGNMTKTVHFHIGTGRFTIFLGKEEIEI